MILLEVEEGETNAFNYDDKVTDKLKDSRGKAIASVDRTVQKSGLSTEYTKHYVCNHCGHTKAKKTL